MLFAVNRISTTDLKKSGVILITTLSVAILILINLYLFFVKLTPDKSSVFIETTFLVALFSSVVISLLTAQRLGFRSKEGKYYLSLVIAMALWACAESIWTYFELALGIETPYLQSQIFFGC